MFYPRFYRASRFLPLNRGLSRGVRTKTQLAIPNYRHHAMQNWSNHMLRRYIETMFGIQRFLDLEPRMIHDYVYD